MSIPKIYIAGHLGMVGSAIARALRLHGGCSIVTRTRDELDLTNQSDVLDFFKSEKPNQVYLSAAKVGGIFANNTYPADFIYQNLMIQSNVIHAAFCCNVKKLLFLGSSCIYPKYALQPITELALLNGALEPTNEPYAIAKIAGIKLCESYNRQYGTDYRCVMPSNLYGQGDNYDSSNSHVIPALLLRFHEAKVKNYRSVSIWGSGLCMREFLFVDDLAEAVIMVMNLEKPNYMSHTKPMLSHINVGSGLEISINELARLIAKTVDYTGEIIFDYSKPDGPPRKLMDNSIMKKLGWSPRINLEEGLRLAYVDFLRNHLIL